MTDENEPIAGVLRRTVLRASAVAVGTLGTLGTTAADGHGGTGGDNGDDGGGANGNGTDESEDDGDSEAEAVDEPDGFEVEILAPHAPLVDDVTAELSLEFADGHEGDPIVVDLDDASTLVVAEVTWTPGGTSGWHRHPGPVLVNVVEGELELVWERDCVPRTYTAGESFLDPGEVHTATNTSNTECARAYAMFLAIPDGEPATVWVPPVDC